MSGGGLPSNLSSDVVLRDGSTVRIRPAQPEDLARVQDYLLGLSPETRRLRFWTAAVNVGELARKIVDVDDLDHLTLLVLRGGDVGRMIGGAQFSLIDGGRVVIGMFLADDLQGMGRGSI